jgi:hypothetical protein
MFTSAIDDRGREFQFKCGWDDCDTYRLGDKVDQKVFPDELFAGKLLDGAYHAEHGRWVGGKLIDHAEKWVIIRNGFFVALVDVERDAGGQMIDGEYVQGDVIARRHGVMPYPLDTWTDAAYLKHAKEQAESARRQRDWDVEDYGKTPMEKAFTATNRFMKQKMKEDGFYRRILPPVPAETDVAVPADLFGITVRESAP